MPKGIPDAILSYRQVLRYERVCRFLEAQPYLAISYPFPSDPPITAKLLKRMAAHGFVRHTQECRWKVPSCWQALLRRLLGVVPDDRATPPDPLRGDPFVVDTNDERLHNIPATLILLQAINHGADHRAQIATLLSQYGITLPEVDGWAYFEPAQTL
jgi:hypothetical protein